MAVAIPFRFRVIGRPVRDGGVELTASDPRELVRTIYEECEPGDFATDQQPFLEVWGVSEIYSPEEERWVVGPAVWLEVLGYGPLPLGDPDELDEYIGATWSDIDAIALPWSDPDDPGEWHAEW